MQKEIYTPMESLLIEALKTHENMIQALQLDLLLLAMEEKQDMIDGIKGEEYLC